MFAVIVLVVICSVCLYLIAEGFKSLRADPWIVSHSFTEVDWMRKCGHLDHPAGSRCYQPKSAHKEKTKEGS